MVAAQCLQSCRSRAPDNVHIIRQKGGGCDLSNCGTVVGDKQAGLSISETEILTSWDTRSLKFTQNGTKKKTKKKTTDRYALFMGGQKTLARLERV